MRGPNTFKRNDLRRAIRSAREAGLVVDHFSIGTDGGFTVFTREPGEPFAETSASVKAWEAAAEKLKAKTPTRAKGR